MELWASCRRELPVCAWAAITKYHRPEGWWTEINVPVPEAASPRSGRQHGWALYEALWPGPSRPVLTWRVEGAGDSGSPVRVLHPPNLSSPTS